jgi:hypothetical protein
LEIKMAYQINVVLRTKRAEGGQLVIIDTLTGLSVLGPIPCLGKAANDTASQKGNAGARSIKPWGDTPIGAYDITGTLGPETDPKRIYSYGVYRRFTLIGVSGDAKIRESVSPNQIRIHGGEAAKAPSGSAALRRTNGCIRVFNWDIKLIFDFINDNLVSYPIKLIITEGDTVPIVSEIADNSYIDPDY